MKDGIHPTYHPEVTVTCSCGNTFVTGSTAASIRIEICAQCHPLFTGKAKIIDTAGRVDKFKARLAKAADFQKKSRKKTAKAAAPGTAGGALVTDEPSVAKEGAATANETTGATSGEPAVSTEELTTKEPTHE
ncbi:50S ribosomal protein L31 [Candidatus Berkelbacteria bacterium]|nr:50S ribosomal protein L31 [Candidatus Berkelbacteria bacterium]